MFNSIDYQQSYIVKEKYLNSYRFKQKFDEVVSKVNYLTFEPTSFL